MRLALIDVRRLVFAREPGPDTLTVDLDSLRTFAKLNNAQLRTLYSNVTGWPYTGKDYNALCQICRALAERQTPHP